MSLKAKDRGGGPGGGGPGGGSPEEILRSSLSKWMKNAKRKSTSLQALEEIMENILRIVKTIVEDLLVTCSMSSINNVIIDDVEDCAYGDETLFKFLKST